MRLFSVFDFFFIIHTRSGLSQPLESHTLLMWTSFWTPSFRLPTALGRMNIRTFFQQKHILIRIKFLGLLERLFLEFVAVFYLDSPLSTQHWPVTREPAFRFFGRRSLNVVRATPLKRLVWKERDLEAICYQPDEVDLRWTSLLNPHWVQP